MNIVKTLSQLTCDDLKKYPTWQSIGNYAEDEDAQIKPLILNDLDKIPLTIEEIWCLCEAIFADNSKHLAVAMCRGDSSDGPLLCSVWNGIEFVPLFFPPAPTIVLEKKGDNYFSIKFNIQKNKIYPLRINVLSRFESNPEIRTLTIEPW